MAQNLSMIASQSMRLEQRLTPQLIQSMEILQLPLMALEARVREELESNPVLEDGDAAATAASESPVEQETTTALDSPAPANQEAESFERLERMSREYDFDSGDQPYGRAAAATGERDAKLDAMANSAARGMSLQDYLDRQWSLMDLSPEVRQAGLKVIEWMDPDGYLRRKSEQPAADSKNGEVNLPLIIRRDTQSMELLDDEIARCVNPPIDAGVLEEAIARVQTLEPRGVGARDLAECLLIQLDALPEPDELAERLVENHLDDIANNKFPAIARETGHTIDEIRGAMAVLAHLQHHPGLTISPNEVPRVTPDVIVDYSEDGTGYVVRLARGNTPQLRISQQYRNILLDPDADKDLREFIKKKLEAASALIDAIHFRRDRLLEIAKIVVDRQRDFLDSGPQYLKTLLMRDIATELKCDPSTISRGVDGKYLQTPRGIYPMRMFFTIGPATANNEGMSWNAVKMRVKEIVDAEDKNEPLNDDEIVQRLSAEGHADISRRTVAKYRARLNIPAARQRKQF